MREEQAAKFTRGPWRATFDGHGGMSIDCHEGQIAFVSNRRAQQANASLIAAAPDLLDALLRLLVATPAGNEKEHHPECRCYRHQAYAAIARATGRSE